MRTAVSERPEARTSASASACELGRGSSTSCSPAASASASGRPIQIGSRRRRWRAGRRGARRGSGARRRCGRAARSRAWCPPGWGSGSAARAARRAPCATGSGSRRRPSRGGRRRWSAGGRRGGRARPRRAGPPAGRRSRRPARPRARRPAAAPPAPSRSSAGTLGDPAVARQLVAARRPLAQRAQAQHAPDPAQPGPEALRVVQAVELEPGHERGVLRHVGAAGRIAERARARAHQPRTVALEQRGERRHVAGTGAGHQEAIGLGHLSTRESRPAPGMSPSIRLRRPYAAAASARACANSSSATRSAAWPVPPSRRLASCARR